jgi:hypothetical protein
MKMHREAELYTDSFLTLFCSPLQLVFVDFQQAFDTLKHEAIWKALKEKGVPHKIVMTYRPAMSCIQI